MIWALEAAERDERFSCSECDARLQARRGCRRPGSTVTEETCHRTTSPLLAKNGQPAELRECPVGAVLREAPYLYDAIGMCSHLENGAVSPLALSPWHAAVARVVFSERARHRDAKSRGKTCSNDAALARRVVGA